MSLKRAVSDGDKQKKRQLIIDTAASLFRTSSFNDIKMIDVAKGAGMAKGTLFLYFKTKEELFLELSRQTFSGFFDKANTALEYALTDDTPKTIDMFIEAIGAFLEENPLMRPLASITNAILEQNVSYDVALEFKVFLNHNLGQTGHLIEKFFTNLKPGDGVKILLWHFSLIIGLQHLAEPSEICREVLAKEHLPHLDVDFREHFGQICRLLLMGFGCK